MLHGNSVEGMFHVLETFRNQNLSETRGNALETLSAKDPNFEATRLHFENLGRRYGNPIIVLNLIKKRHKRVGDSWQVGYLCTELDLHLLLSANFRWVSEPESIHRGAYVYVNFSKSLGAVGECFIRFCPGPGHALIIVNNIGECSTYDLLTKDEIASDSAVENGTDSKDRQKEATMLQKGVLRTNCIDCLDRTNVAQYAYGLVAFGRQLHALGLTESTTIDLDNPLAEDLIGVYETMGDALALQYGGSTAHNKIFCERRGQWKAATQSQELFRTLQRYYSNAYMDAEKQDAINLFLGYFKPQLDKPTLWELGSDQHYNAARFLASSEKNEEVKGHSDSAPGIISTSKTTAMIAGSFSAPPATLEDIGLDEILENDCFCFNADRRGGDQCTCAAFDMDWVSSSGASCEDESYGRSTVVRSFESIPESTKIESEICVVNAKVSK
ncbi:hypothetical protein YC2023_094417 [Brassica napus]